MPDEYIKIGKDNYRHIVSTDDKEKVKRVSNRYREDGKLVRVLKRKHMFSSQPDMTVFDVYYCTSRRRRL